MDGGLDDRALRRIIALLVSFAVLAERTGTRSLPVRWLVLTILRYAERVALGCLAETTGIDWAACFEDHQEPGSSPADAALLAWRLRALAGLLGELLPPANPFDVWETGREAAQRDFASCVLFSFVTPGAWPHQAPDTS